jgi:hypothetical protein
MDNIQIKGIRLGLDIARSTRIFAIGHKGMKIKIFQIIGEREKITQNKVTNDRIFYRINLINETLLVSRFASPFKSPRAIVSLSYILFHTKHLISPVFQWLEIRSYRSASQPFCVLFSKKFPGSDTILPLWFFFTVGKLVPAFGHDLSKVFHTCRNFTPPMGHNLIISMQFTKT